MAGRAGTSAPRRISLAGLAALFVAGCGAGGESATTPSPTPAPAATPTPSAVASPSPSPSRPAAVFTATVSAAEGAAVRSQPGTDAPVVRVDAAPSLEGFDGWYRRTDGPPVVDAVTGRIEPWSRDWFRLADGTGWISSASVRGFQPPSLPPLAWTRPADMPLPDTVELPVAFDHQDYASSCEVAALKMALTVEGIHRTEDQLLDVVGVDPRPPEVDDKGRVIRWGNPDRVFVGDPDGHPSDLTGYGVHVAPIARTARTVGATVLASGTGMSPDAIYTALRAGHPVVAWITVDYRPTTLHWFHTFDGESAWYSTLEHAVALVGVSPDAVLVDDPARQLAWHPRAEFEAGFDLLHRMAVILE